MSDTKKDSLRPSIDQIETTLQKKYLERLNLRVRKIRLLLLERQWEELRAECHQIAHSSEGFGLPTLRTIALQAEEAIPPGRVSRASALPHARGAVENLITSIDVLLTNESVEKNLRLQDKVFSK